MATNITFAVPDADVTDYTNAFGQYYSAIIKNAQGEDIANPESKALFAKKRAAEYLAQFVYEYKKKVQIDSIVVSKPNIV